MDDTQLHERLQTVLGTGYSVEKILGRGGCAVVFSARDQRLGRDVAVKVLRPDLDAPVTRERFRREAESVARLRHPNVIHVLDIGEAGGITWFTMPLIQGEGLRGRLDREGKLDVAEALRILSECAKALDAAHMLGMVHRDIKPDNVLLDGNSGSVVLTDFGLVKSLTLDDSGLTTSGMVVGTPHYMSPEQLAGDAPVDARTDIWALGVMGYRMLSGVLPFDAKAVPMLVAKVLAEDPTPIEWRRPEVPKAMAEAVMRCMAKAPEDRWASAAEFEQALTTVMAPRPAPRRSSVRRSSAVTIRQVETAMATPDAGLPHLPDSVQGRARGAMRLTHWRRYFVRMAGWWLLGTVLWGVLEFALTGRVLYAWLWMLGAAAQGASMYAKAWLRGFGWRELLGLREPPDASHGPAFTGEFPSEEEEESAAEVMLDGMQTDRRIVVALMLRTARHDLERAPDYRRTVDDAIREAEAAAERVAGLDEELASIAGRRSAGRKSLGRISTGRALPTGRQSVGSEANQARALEVESQRDELLHAMRQSAEAVRALRLRLQEEGVQGGAMFVEVVSGATQRLRMRGAEMAEA
ncbi:MAG: serine/threonine protein kinase [Gemmatimonadetes bacterium]|nr:serine/threonine protein kinase [Gemmatimonadota bacterium]